MNTQQVYQKYLTPKNLQEHMMRVAALAEIISEKWKGKEFQKMEVVWACLFHDIAKPINFDPDSQAQFGMPEEDIFKLKKLQEILKDKYGNNEHQITLKICAEIGLGEKALQIANNLEWSYIPKLLKENDWESLLAIYGDMRIGPKGILTLEERLADLKRRIKEEFCEEFVINGKLLEQKIRDNISIDLNVITEKEIEERFEKMKILEIN
jgi:putative nucleotidyltransferase with HDIG domain